MTPMQEPNWGQPSLPTPSLPAKKDPAPSSEAILLQSLVSALKGSEGLSEEAQQLLQQADLRGSQLNTKHMHSVVSKIGNAQKVLAETSMARAQLHQAWRNFLVDAVKRWEGYTQDFAQQDAELANKIQQARTTLTEARRSGSQMMTKETGAKDAENSAEEQAEIIEDDMDEEGESKGGDSQIQSGIANMQEALGSLKTTAEEMAASSQRAAKRFKAAEAAKGSAAGLAAPPMFGSGALQPFHKADK